MTRRLIPTLALAGCLAIWAAPADAQDSHGPESSKAGKAASGAKHSDEGHGFGQAGGHSGTEASHDAHGGHEKAPLLPDATKRETIMSAVWVLVIFIALLAILYPTAWKNVLAGLKAREERIRKDIADAEAARTRAEATLKEYNSQLAAAESRVRDMLAKATAEGEQIAAGIRTRAQQEAEETKERALRDIDAARDQAVSQVHEQAAVLATSVAEKILRRNLNPDDQRDLVAQSLDQLRTVGGEGGARARGAGGNGRGRA